MTDTDKRATGRVTHHGDLLHREFMLAFDRPQFRRDQLRDLSDTGVGFQSAHQYGMGSLVEARLEIIGWTQHASAFYTGDPHMATQPLVAILKVVALHALPGGGWKVGCAFESIDEGHRVALRRYLASRSGPTA
jgi:hypothetical protein